MSLKCTIENETKWLMKKLADFFPTTIASVLQKSDVWYQIVQNAFDSKIRMKETIQRIEADRKELWDIAYFENWWIFNKELIDIVESIIFEHWDSISSKFRKTLERTLTNLLNIESEAWRNPLLKKTYDILYTKWQDVHKILSFMKAFNQWDYKTKLEEFIENWDLTLMEELYWIDWTKLTPAEAFWFNHLLWPDELKNEKFSYFWWMHAALEGNFLYRKFTSAALYVRNIWRLIYPFVSMAWYIWTYALSWIFYLPMSVKKTSRSKDLFLQATNLMLQADEYPQVIAALKQDWWIMNRIRVAYSQLKTLLSEKKLVNKMTIDDWRNSIKFWVEQLIYSYASWNEIWHHVVNVALERWISEEQFAYMIKNEPWTAVLIVSEWYHRYRGVIWVWENSWFATDRTWSKSQVIMWGFSKVGTWMLSYFLWSFQYMVKTIIEEMWRTAVFWKERYMWWWSASKTATFLNWSSPFLWVLSMLINWYIMWNRMMRIWDDDDEDEEKTFTEKMKFLFAFISSTIPWIVWGKILFDRYWWLNPFPYMLWNETGLQYYKWAMDSLERMLFPKTRILLKFFQAWAWFIMNEENRNLAYLALSLHSWWIYYMLWEWLDGEWFALNKFPIYQEYKTMLFSTPTEYQNNEIEKIKKNIKMWITLEDWMMNFLWKEFPLVWDFLAISREFKNRVSDWEIEKVQKEMIANEWYKQLVEWKIPQDISNLEWAIYRDRYFKWSRYDDKNDKFSNNLDLIYAEYKNAWWNVEEAKTTLASALSKASFNEKNKISYAQMQLMLDKDVKNPWLVREMLWSRLEAKAKNELWIRWAWTTEQQNEIKWILFKQYWWLLNSELKDRSQYNLMMSEYLIRRLPSFQKYVTNLDDMQSLVSSDWKASSPRPEFNEDWKKVIQWHWLNMIAIQSIMKWDLDWYAALNIKDTIDWLYPKSPKSLESIMDFTKLLVDVAHRNWYDKTSHALLVAPLIAKSISMLPAFIESNDVSQESKNDALNSIFNISKDIVKSVEESKVNDEIWFYDNSTWKIKWSSYKKYKNSYDSIKDYYQKQPYYEKYYPVYPAKWYWNYKDAERDTIKNYSRAYWEQYFVRLNWYDKTSFLTPDGISGWKSTVLKPKAAQPRLLWRRAIFAKSIEAANVTTPGNSKPIVWTLNDWWLGDAKRKKSSWTSRKTKS